MLPLTAKQGDTYTKYSYSAKKPSDDQSYINITELNTTIGSSKPVEYNSIHKGSYISPYKRNERNLYEEYSPSKVPVRMISTFLPSSVLCTLV